MAGVEIIMFIDFIQFGFLSFRSSDVFPIGAEIYALLWERR